MTEPEPAANPQAQVTEEMIDGAPKSLRGWARAYRDGPKHLRFPSDPDAEFFPVDLELAARVLEHLASRPAADRGQIVEECARVADKYARQLGSRLGRQAASDITASIRALSPRSRTDGGIDDGR